MESQFLVDRAFHFPSSGIYALSGKVLRGNISPGDTLIATDDPSKRVRVLSIAIVCKQEKPNSITFSIEKPSFPVQELEGLTLVSFQN